MKRILIESNGKQASGLAQGIDKKLNNEFKEEYEIDFSDSIGLGVLETLVITITGAVVSNLIIRLLDIILNKNNKSVSKIEIRIHHIDSNAEFNLPEESSEMLEHFKKINETTDKAKTDE